MTIILGVLMLVLDVIALVNLLASSMSGARWPWGSWASLPGWPSSEVAPHSARSAESLKRRKETEESLASGILGD
jgi:hypothetical protein